MNRRTREMTRHDLSGSLLPQGTYGPWLCLHSPSTLRYTTVEFGRGRY